MENDVSQITRIRPAARIISTIGEDLVGDAYAAIVELVKNAYDADADLIQIIFNYITIETEPVLNIQIIDNGHGMTEETVLNNWLVPATKDKVNRQSSPKGRLFQGKKGIGRYAAAILGQELLMKTTTKDSEQTEVLIDWSLFETTEYLSDVDILVTHRKSDEEKGTLLSINAIKEKLYQWGKNELSTLTKELRKLKSPFAKYTPDQFEIQLAFFNCPFEEYNNQIFEIEAFPIIELFDYRISGNANENGLVTALYENKSEPNLPSEVIELKIKLQGGQNYCGPIEFDFRVFDRDKEAIDNLINKGLIDPISQLVFGKTEAKQMLNQVYGVNLYREGFRIRPYGNGGIDWLNLDKDRIQNPSQRIGNNQVVGFVNIKPELISNLEEKSARDGLKETSYYFGLISILKNVIHELETRRFAFRQNTGKGRKSKTIQSELNELFDFDSLNDQIQKSLTSFGIQETTREEITNLIYKEANTKIKLLENIQNTIAIYQGQATLGKIVTVLLHEGRKPLSYFRQQSPNLARWLNYYRQQGIWDDDIYDDILDRLKNFQQQSEILSSLFKRLDPLSKQNKGERKEFNIRKAILKAKDIFEGTLTENSISFTLNCPTNINIISWEEDLIIAVTNLLENSIYWLNEYDKPGKHISVDVIKEDTIIIHYRDNGPGIDRPTIESGAIFEPGFSKKLDGTGLGLPIAGEAVERLHGNIAAHFSNSGAYFTIEIV